MCHDANAGIGDPEGADTSFCPAELNRSRNLRYASERTLLCGSARRARREARSRPARVTGPIGWQSRPRPETGARVRA